MKKLVLAVLVGTLCLGATSAYAQKNLMKGAAKAVSSKAPASLGRQVERQLAKQITKYDPVFGYILPEKPVLSFTPDLRTPFHHTGIEEPIAALQVKPIVDKNQIQTAFRMYKDLNLVQATEMIYLWRLAHPSKNVLPPALEWLAIDILKTKRYETYDNKMENLPNILFLEYLTAWYLPAPSSYAKLVETTPVYPKRITLDDDYGFPIKAEGAEEAKRLDLYLILSNPKEMGAYNNSGKYTPFVLTKEEHAAANKLLALRQTAEKLPQNPTPSDLLELAYNRLEAHLVPYSSVKYNRILRRWAVNANYKAYPNYKNTQLYRSIKGMIRDQKPIKSYDGYYYTLENIDMTHLIVLDAVMGGVEPDNLAEVSRALNAFEELCAEVQRKDTQAIAHLAILHTNLRVVFKDLISFADEKIDLMDPQWEKWRIAEEAWSLLEANSIFNLVGRNWERHY